MKVVFVKDVAGIARKHDVKTVSDGYARNFLLPNGLAIVATDSTVSRISAEQDQRQASQDKRLSQLAEAGERVGGKTVTIKVKANNKGMLFAAVHAEQIVTAIKQQLGESFEASQIETTISIKSVGEHPITLVLPDRRVSLKVVVSNE